MKGCSLKGPGCQGVTLRVLSFFEAGSFIGTSILESHPLMESCLLIPRLLLHQIIVFLWKIEDVYVYLPKTRLKASMARRLWNTRGTNTFPQYLIRAQLLGPCLHKAMVLLIIWDSFPYTTAPHSGNTLWTRLCSPLELFFSAYVRYTIELS